MVRVLLESCGFLIYGEPRSTRKYQRDALRFRVRARRCFRRSSTVRPNSKLPNESARSFKACWRTTACKLFSTVSRMVPAPRICLASFNNCSSTSSVVFIHKILREFMYRLYIPDRINRNCESSPVCLALLLDSSSPVHDRRERWAFAVFRGHGKQKALGVARDDEPARVC